MKHPKTWNFFSFFYLIVQEKPTQFHYFFFNQFLINLICHFVKNFYNVINNFSNTRNRCIKMYQFKSYLKINRFIHYLLDTPFHFPILYYFFYYIFFIFLQLYLYPFIVKNFNLFFSTINQNHNGINSIHFNIFNGLIFYFKKY